MLALKTNWTMKIMKMDMEDLAYPETIIGEIVEW